MPTEETPRQKKQALYPASCGSMGDKSKKSLWMISVSFECCVPQGLRPTTKTFSTSGERRHSCRTPSPTMPLAPVMITRIVLTELYYLCENFLPYRLPPPILRPDDAAAPTAAVSGSIKAT